MERNEASGRGTGAPRAAAPAGQRLPPAGAAAYAAWDQGNCNSGSNDGHSQYVMPRNLLFEKYNGEMVEAMKPIIKATGLAAGKYAE